MDIKVPEGKYILAVSGGVDSMVLLDLLSNLPKVELVVAHFDHGIRSDSARDELFVRRAAKNYGLPYEAGFGKLGHKASEDQARQARYAFLDTVRLKHGAAKLITAHHQDDLIETALLNLLRGSGRRGLSAIADNPLVVRPLLQTPKKAIVAYAKAHHLAWRDDPSNNDTKYLRNYLRHRVLPNLRPAQRRALIGSLNKTAAANQSINAELSNLSGKIQRSNQIDRQLFASLPANVSRELLVHWLRNGRAGEIDKPQVDRLNLAIRAAQAGTTHAVKGKTRLVIGARAAHFETTP